MAQYGYTFAYELMDINYDKTMHIVENMVQDTNFINFLTEETVLHEFSIKDTVSKFIKKFKEIAEKVINFLISIPGKIKSLIAKSSEKTQSTDKVVEEIKEKEKETKEKEPEFIFEDKEYEEEIYDFTSMVSALFDRNNFMFDDSATGYKAFVDIKKAAEDFENNYGSRIFY